MYKKIVKVLMLMFFLSQTFILSATGEKRVLFISSYHPSFPTFFEQVNGIRDVFANEEVILDIEFMDSKRFFDNDVQGSFLTLLQLKLDKLPPYDGVITSDDNALRFITAHQNVLFPNTPIIFCGVNNVEYAIGMDRNEYITGFVEDTSMEDTIDLIMEIHNISKILYIITDSTTSGQADLEKITDIIYTNYNLGLEVLDTSNISFNQLAKELSSIPPEQPVLLLSLYKDSEGVVKTFGEGLDLILSNLQAPLYHLWFHGLGDGIVGGKLISHYEQGRSAATLMNSVLKGSTQMDDTLVNRVSPNKFYFDDEVLRRFNIKTSSLPEDSTIINKRTSFLSENIYLVVSVLIFILLLLLIILLLMLNGKIKKKLIEEHKSVISYITKIINTLDIGIITIDDTFNIIRENDFVMNILKGVRLNSESFNVFTRYPFLEKYNNLITGKDSRGIEGEFIEFINNRFLRISVSPLDEDIERGTLIKLQDVTDEVVAKKKVTH